MQRRERASEYVIESFVGTSLFYGEEVGIFFNDTQERLISLLISTITTFGGAHILQSSAARTDIDVFVDIDELF